jgi:hypothetical protein
MKRRKSVNKYAKVSEPPKMNVGATSNTSPASRDVIMKALSLGIATGVALPEGGYMDEIDDEVKGDDKDGEI